MPVFKPAFGSPGFVFGSAAVAVRGALIAVVMSGALVAGGLTSGCGGNDKPATTPGGTGGVAGTGSGGTTTTPGAGSGGTTSTGSGGMVATGSGGRTGSGGSVTPGGGSGGTTTTPDAAGPGDTSTPPADAAAGVCAIPCIVTIDSECKATGACTEQAGALGSNNRCYANGVKVINALSLSLMPSLTTTQRKSDGSVCFTMTGMLSGQMATLTWKTAAGTTIATGTYDTTSMKAKVTCTGGQTYDATPGDACASKLNLPTLPGMTPPPSSCTMGTCN